MKKAFCIVTMLCAILSGAFAQNAGVIKEMTGEVELKPAGSAAFVPARAGSEVAQDTVVSTGFKGTAIIAVGSSTITVRPLTRLSLSELQVSSGSENLNMNLQAGRVRVDVKPPEGTRANFTVQSPSATASVRGTSFEFDTRNLSVIEGTVSFQGLRGAPRPVSAGFRSSLDRNVSAADPSDISKSNVMPSSPAGTESSGGANSAPLPTGIGGGTKSPSSGGGGGSNSPSTGGVDIEIGY